MASKKKIISEYFAKIGARGGKATKAKKGFGSLTPEERTAQAKAAAAARWGKVKPPSVPEGQ